MLKLRSNFEAVVYVISWYSLVISFFSAACSKLTNLIKLRETTKASWLECALSIFQARYAACPLGGNRRVSFSELCVLSAFLFYDRPDASRSPMMKHQRQRRRPTHHTHCRPITTDTLIIMLVPIWKPPHWWTVVVIWQLLNISNCWRNWFVSNIIRRINCQHQR